MQSTITNTFHNLPDEMKELKQWILWRLEEKRDKNGNIKYDKVPKQVNGYNASPTNAEHYVTFKQAMAAFQTGNFSGIGFSLMEEDPFTIIDLDNCFDEDGQLTDKAKTIVDTLGSYTEISQSGNGLHIIVKSDNIDGFNNQKEKIEMYSNKRFFAMTGNVFNGLTTIEERNDIVLYLHETFNTKNKRIKNEVVGDNQETLSDDDLLNKIRKSKQGDKFFLLYDGDTSNYDSESEADFALANMLAWWTKNNLQIERIMRNSALYREKWDKHPNYLQGRTIQNALQNNAGEGYEVNGEFQLGLKEDETSIIPQPFLQKYSNLYKTVMKGTGKNEEEIEIFISRQIPYLTKEFQNIETSGVLYELSWKDRNHLRNEVIQASTIAVRKELLELSNKGLSVNEVNVRELISFFDKYLQINELEQHFAVERLGHIKNEFIHPLLNRNIEILAMDYGEKSILEAFEVKGTSQSWKEEVFELIKDSPKAVFMVLSSFTSVILKDLRIQPFIVDLSGTTSQGKTTTLKVAASVWGNEYLMSEWNATKVAIERKAAYLNSFPLLLDDTRKANEKALSDIIYQFSGGRSKGRGSVTGSQREYTWNNILLSTGETSLNDYARDKGGAAARIIPLVDEPLKRDQENIFNLYDGLENNYGAIGIEFMNMWLQNKEELIPEYKKFRKHYLDKSKNNEVLSRLAVNYAAVHFTGSVLKSKLGLDINLKSISDLFDEIAEENKAIDKPMQFLEEILIELDSDRKSILDRYLPKEKMKAIYKSKQKQLFLTPSFLTEFLGVEEKQTRKEWLKRKITIPIDKDGKEVDYTRISHKGTRYRAIALNMEVVNKLGFDFHSYE